MSEILPEGAIIKVEMEVRLPVSATMDQVDEWLTMELTQSGGIHMGNPLTSTGIDAWYGPELEFTGETGRREKYDVKELPNGGSEYRVRRILEPV